MGVIIIGAGGFGKEVLDLLRCNNKEIIGFIDLKVNGEVNGVPVLGGDEKLEELKDSELEAVVAIGIPKVRKKMFEKLKELGYKLPNVIHPFSYISKNVEMGEGCLVYAGVVVNTDVKMGNSVLLNSNSSIGHETIVGSYVNIDPSAAIAGRVKIGDCSFVGIGACTIENLTIGKNSIIGAGAVVVRDIPDNVIAYGVPAKVMKNIESSEAT